MNGFRLLSVEASTPLDSASLFEDQYSPTQLAARIAPELAESLSSENWMSVVTGRNGRGKSRMLAATASLFEGAPRGRIKARNTSGVHWRVRYESGGRACELWTSGSKGIRGSMDGKSYPADEMPLPKKVIAISTTVSDKFPLPPRLDTDDDVRDDFYSYMGLRDGTGRASATAVVYRALEVLVAATGASQERRGRIAQVFEFLGYEPRVEHTYRWRYASLLNSGIDLRALLDVEPPNFPDRNVASRLRRLVASDPSIIDDIQAAMVRALERTEGKEVRLATDFRNPDSKNRATFDDVRLLRIAGMVTLTSVDLLHSNSGARIDFREASSGELSLATAFLGLAAVIEDDSLVLIDEPEVSLHPQWQSDYLSLLGRVFSAYRGCHFVVATHSPLVVSGVSSESSNVVSLDASHQGLETQTNVAGESTDEVLVRTFDVLGNNNLFVKQRLVHAMRLAADGSLGTEGFDEAIEPLVPLLERMDGDDPVRELIAELLRAREELVP